jgi:dihydrofolate reductase
MAKVIVWNLMTLDGLFEGPTKWDLAFHEDAWCDELSDLSKSFGEKAGLLVFGRVTYEGMKAHWTKTTDEDSETKVFMNALPKLVASRSLTASDWNNTQVTNDIAGELARRKAEAGKDIYVIGSAELTDSLLRDGLVDEIMLCIAPVLLGAGTPLFKPGSPARKLSLTQSRPLSNGAVILTYAVAS